MQAFITARTMFNGLLVHIGDIWKYDNAFVLVLGFEKYDNKGFSLRRNPEFICRVYDFEYRHKESMTFTGEAKAYNLISRLDREQVADIVRKK